jgi:hypothetical protein
MSGECCLSESNTGLNLRPQEHLLNALTSQAHCTGNWGSKIDYIAYEVHSSRPGGCSHHGKKHRSGTNSTNPEISKLPGEKNHLPYVTCCSKYFANVNTFKLHKIGATKRIAR